MPLQFKGSRVRRGRYFVDSTETVRHNHETSAIWDMLHFHRRHCDNISVEGGHNITLIDPLGIRQEEFTEFELQILPLP